MRKVLRHEELDTLKSRSALLQGAFLLSCPPSVYPSWYPPKYINDFSIISNKTQIISTIFLIYQRFDTTYRFTDNLRQGQTSYIPPIPQTPLK
ncbi:hypothetical protein CN578_09865 [Bacillus toyonensis]|nr:hypothetical protein CN642_03745 [Bacillus toyonensis]PEP16843.1 hypothetical protein CN578_09865 [Bacillus toyonensis]PGE52942.1 hypothetical protein COM53_02735 [Bacillus toyonensis]PHC19958.1 hypothetical protein COF03_13705 [Bacillus toyonensis]PHD95575.1 hypothetical protein COF43_26270 [Bacillus toyonensis]